MFKQSNGYSFYIDEKLFINNYKSNFVSLNYNSTSSVGSSSNTSMFNSLMGSIGEAFERQVLIGYFDSFYKERLVCYNLYSKTLEYKHLDNFYKKYFYDTTGLATHCNSKNCLTNSLNEFIERQSFILSYLSNTANYKIRKDISLYELTKDYFSFVNFYDISFIDTVKTVIGLGEISEGFFNIGLGTGANIKDAIKNCIKEIYPLRSKHIPIPLNKEEPIDYIHIFNSLKLDKITQSYQYLDLSPEKSITEYNDINFWDFDLIVDELYGKYDIQPLMCSLFNSSNNYYRNNAAKNTKVFAEKWFPSLRVFDFDDEIYSNVENVTGLTLNRTTNFIPFP